MNEARNGPTGAIGPPPLWLTDWSDVEDRSFRAALAESGETAEILRIRRHGQFQGPWHHRLRSYPTYLELALRGRIRRPHGPLVAWQPLAGVPAALLPGDHVRRLALINPLFPPDASAAQRRLLISGINRANRTAFLARAAVDRAVQLGVDRERAQFVPFGVRARMDEPTESSGEFYLAIGREIRDWATLAKAAEGLDREVLVVGPKSLDGLEPLRVVQTGSRDGTFELMERACAVVVPLKAAKRQAGLLVVLDAFSAGRPVIATENPATIDYVTDERGRVVPPEDPAALRTAMEELADPQVSAELGAGALRAAQGELAMHRFIRDMHELAVG